MRTVILDDDLRAKLNGMTETIDICEPSGATVGHFVPHDEYMKLLYALAKTEVPLEELKRRAAQPGGKKLADFWKEMGEDAVRFDVDWQPTALSELAEIWNTAGDRAAVTRASNEMDRLLERDAVTLGESREETFRVFILSPLGIEFQVFEADLRAVVVRIWRLRQSQP